jgi:hypothetical protein
MHKHIRTTATLDESITLGIVEPLNGSGFALSHPTSPTRSYYSRSGINGQA